MASTYTPAGIELIGDGEQSTTWGDTTNTNWELIEELATGGVSISLSSATYTLTTTDGATSNGRHAVITFTGSPGATCVVTVSPNDMQKLYFIRNTSDQTVTMKQGTGSTVDIAADKSAIVHCNGAGSGAAVVSVSDGFDSTTLAELGVTSTAAELNILDGVTSTAAELNILDGVTATTAELNYVDGVTSAIQTQLDAKLEDGDTASAMTITTANITTVDLGDWTITESSGVLYFATNGTNKMKLDASGNLTVVGDVAAYGTM